LNRASVAHLESLLYVAHRNVERVLANHPDGGDATSEAGRAIVRRVDKRVRLNLVSDTRGVNLESTVECHRAEDDSATVDRTSRLPPSTVVKRLQARERRLVLDNLVALAGDAEHTVAATHRGDDSLSRNHEVSVIDNVLEVIGLVRPHGVLDGNGHLTDVPISKASETKHLVRVGNLLGEDSAKTVPRGLTVRSKEVNPAIVSDCSNH